MNGFPRSILYASLPVTFSVGVGPKSQPVWSSPAVTIRHACRDVERLCPGDRPAKSVRGYRVARRVVLGSKRQENYVDKQDTKKPLTPLAAIKLHCLECSHDSAEDVRECPAAQTCSLWAFRFGTSPTVSVKQEKDVNHGQGT